MFFSEKRCMNLKIRSHEKSSYFRFVDDYFGYHIRTGQKAVFQ